jgi:4-diphosphocytidyl-2-C-methyl-D-erythritol kinase
MITFPNSKINLGLWVTQRRADGYHNIQSVLYPVPWCDVLEIVPANGSQTALTVTGGHVEGPVENNLCYRAWRLMADAYSVPPVSMHLHKVVPTGAGLGGGSSDASFVLRMLNSMFNLELDHDTLRSLAVRLGMDCPFFIENIPALSTGRGEFLKPVSLNLDGLFLVVVKPPVHVSTAAAFTGIKPVLRENSIEEFANLPIQEWRSALHNDFEQTVFGLYPEILEIKNILYRNGAIYAAMSGSGSAVYGLFAGNPVKMEFPECEVFQSLLGSQT